MKQLQVALLIFFLPLAGWGEIVDSVVAIVGTQPIKHSDVMRDLRITSFLNQAPLLLTPDQQLAAVNRLVDQAIIRTEMQAGGYAQVEGQQVANLLNQIQQRYANLENFRQNLAESGLTEASLRTQLAWQLSVLDFMETRFGTGPDEDSGTDDAFLRWLDTARKNQRITIRTERLK